MHAPASLHPAPGRPDWTAAELHAAELYKGTCQYLAAAAWDLFVTLTFSRDVPDVVAHLEFRAWARHLARDVCGRHLRVGWVYAPQARGVLHFHALLAAVDHEARLSAEAVGRAWGHGSAVVVPVYSAIEVIDYMLEHTDLTAADIRRTWDLNVACDRRRRCHRARCALAPGPWGAT